MTWGFVAAGVAVVGSSMLKAGSDNAAARASATQQNNESYNSYTNSVKQTMEANRAIGEANTLNIIRAGYKVGILNLQTARLKEQAAVEGWGVSRKASEVLAGAEANAAAAGTVGASVTAVSNDIRKKSQEAQIAVSTNWYHTLENQDIALEQTTQAAQDAQQSVHAIPDISTVNTVSPPQQSGLAAGFGAGLNLFAGSKMSLGGASSSGSSYSPASLLGGNQGSFGLGGGSGLFK